MGTALTSKQIQILNRFLNHIIICFDGDQSGYKAALRAAENIIDELSPDKKISFLLLEDNLDPDNYVNKFGKEKFRNFKSENYSYINLYLNIIWDKQQKVLVREQYLKKPREIAANIKDSFVKNIP